MFVLFRFSGITAEMLENVTTTLADVQKRLIALLPPDAILLGHSLENDLRALKVSYPWSKPLTFPRVRIRQNGAKLEQFWFNYIAKEIAKPPAQKIVLFLCVIRKRYSKKGKHQLQHFGLQSTTITHGNSLQIGKLVQKEEEIMTESKMA